MSVNKDFNILLEKVLRFKRKYYLNKLLRGLILSASMLIVLFIVIDVFEYYSWSNIVVRTTIFYLFLAAITIILGAQVVIPIFHLLKMGKIISHKQAALIIGDHFPEISDKLLNTLQLQSIIKENKSDQINLLLAGIEQKTNELQPIPFRKAISYKSNYKYLKWLALPLVFLLVTLIISPAFVTAPAIRLVNHKQKYEKPKPYYFTIINDSLIAVQGDDFTILVEVEGKEYPETAYLNDGKYDFRLLKNKEGLLEYNFTKLKNDIYFRIATDEVISEQFHIKVLPKPTISSFNIELDFPDYLGKKDEIIESTGDLVIPEGTKLQWRFYAANSQELIFNDEKETSLYSINSQNLFEYDKIALSDFQYSVFSISEHYLHSDTLNYSVNVIKDEKPNIVIDNLQQEYLLGYLMANGTITDDYGFSLLRFYYKKSEENNWSTIDLGVDNKIEKQNFNHSFKTSDIELLPGDNLDFYYQVWDNDRINGYKSAKTNILVFKVPDKVEIENIVDSTGDLMKSKYEKSIKDLEELRIELEELKKDLFEKKELDWSDRKKVKELLKKEKELRESLLEMQELNSRREELKDFLKDNPDESIQEKLDKLYEQIENLKQDELLEKLEELLKNIDELTKDQLDKLLDDLKKNQQDFKLSLEQQLEFFKQIEIEQKLKEIVNDLEELSKKQELLAEETKNKENKLKEAAPEQEELNKDFEKVKEKIQEIDSLNKNLEKPLEMNTKKEEQKEIEKDMSEASENLESGKRKKAGESQSNAAKKMKKLAENLNMMMQSAMQSRMGEDAEQIGKILDNLLDISFNLESLMEEVTVTSDNDPRFIDNTNKLKNLKDDYSVLHDSLLAISKRQILIQQFLVKESDKVEMYFTRSLESIQERQTGQTSSNLQYGMTSANNLALMLDESLNKMKQSMNMPGSKSGEGECNQPGESSGSEGMKQMLKMQQGLGKGLKKAGQKMGSGENPADGSSASSRELARMAAQQSELRKQMQDLMDQIEGNGGNGSALQKIIDQMDMQENDIVNKQITSETLERQREIETRLLKAEKALLKREKEEKREAVVGKNRKRGNPNIEIKYKDVKVDDHNSVINTKPLKLSTPYKKILKKYLYEIESSENN